MDDRKVALWGLAVGVFQILMAHAAFADDANAVQWSATLGATSDYVFRGLSYNDEKPAAQGSIDASYGIVSAGIWASNISDVGYKPAEVDIYTNVKPLLYGVTLDFGIIWYTYPGATSGLGLDSVELKAGTELSPMENLKIAPAFWYVPAQSNAPITYTFESAASYTLPATANFVPALSGLIGHSMAEESDAFSNGVSDYTYWNAGILLAIENFTLDFRYWDSSIHHDGLANERFVFTTTVSLQ